MEAFGAVGADPEPKREPRPVWSTNIQCVVEGGGGKETQRLGHIPPKGVLLGEVGSDGRSIRYLHGLGGKGCPKWGHTS